jgi:DnaJ-class molecular chaperone
MKLVRTEPVTTQVIPQPATDAVKPHPLGICKVCGGITYRKEAVGKRCERDRRGQRCSGTVAVASRDACWKLCASCGGTGKLGAAPCTYCRGIGWNLAKPWSI